MYSTTEAVTCLVSVFLDILRSDDSLAFSKFEDEAIRIGHETIACAIGLALERFDDEVCAGLPHGYHMRDRRSRTLATEIGDVTFSRRRFSDHYGVSLMPLDDALDLPWKTRISPGATAFLIEAGAEVSYMRAAHLLSRSGGSTLSATSVMRAFRQTGQVCEEEDVKAAYELYELGLSPAAQADVEEICLEADGTWISLQKTPPGKPCKAEIKALVAYGGKQCSDLDRKVRRVQPIRHGCIADPQTFWTQGVATVGARFDLTKIKRCHLGSDGEGWCKQGGAYLKNNIVTVGHLDPFHLNRAVTRCFVNPQEASQVLECIWLGDAQEAADMLEELAAEGIAREKPSRQVITYLRTNALIIGVEGPSLGTMEAENQHLYKSRMAAFPCAWSIRGASDMARIRSRIYSRRTLPSLRREDSMSTARRKQRERKTIESLTINNYMPLQYEGRGWESPCRASLSGMCSNVRYASGLHWERRIIDPH